MSYTQEELVQLMITYFQNTTQSEITDFNDGSEVNNLIRSLSNALLLGFEEADEIKRMMNPYEAVGIFLDYLATTRGLTRQAAEYSTGTVTVTLDSPLGYDVTYPYQTYFSTDGIDTIAFYSSDEATISTGNSTVDIPIQAVLAGSDGNVDASTVTVVVSPVTGTETVTNGSGFTGGVDSETDEELRERILSAGLGSSTGTPEWYASTAETVTGVYDAVCIENPYDTDNKVCVYVCGDTRPTTDGIIEDVEDIFSADDGHIAGIEVQVDKPTFLETGVTFTVLSLDPSLNSDTVKSNIEDNISAYMEGGTTTDGTSYDGLSIGDDLVYLTLEQVISNTVGVITFTLSTPTSNVVAGDTDCIYMGSVTFP